MTTLFIKEADNSSWYFSKKAPTNLKEVLPETTLLDPSNYESELCKIRNELKELGWWFYEEGCYTEVYEHNRFPSILFKLHKKEHFEDMYAEEEATMDESIVLKELQHLENVPTLYAYFPFGLIVEKVEGIYLGNFLKNANSFTERSSWINKIIEFGETCMVNGWAPDDLHGENVMIREEKIVCIDYNRFMRVKLYEENLKFGYDCRTWLEKFAEAWGFKALAPAN